MPQTQQVERLLRVALERPVTIIDIEHLAPWSVLRCRFDDPADGPHSVIVPRSVIVKWLREGPHDVRTDPRQVSTELAALEFLSVINFSAAPRLISADLDAGLIIMEDLASHAPLAGLIRERGGAAVVPQLHAFATVSGRLNAASAGKSADYERIRGRYGSPDPGTGRHRGLGPEWPNTLQRLAHIIPMSTGAHHEIGQLIDAMINPGRFLAFSNGDEAPNNALVNDVDAQLIDFEAAGFRHALISAVWIHLPGPEFITVSNEDVGEELEESYRRALLEGIPEADDDFLFGHAMAMACLAFALMRLNRFDRLENRSPGDHSRLQQLCCLESATRVAGRHRAWPHLRGWIDRLADHLRSRWPDVNVDLANYPPYAPRR